jgi:hypothetical protein
VSNEDCWVLDGVNSWATQAELMHRACHKSSVAAQRHQHATKDRDRALAHALVNLAWARNNEIDARDGADFGTSTNGIREENPGHKWCRRAGLAILRLASYALERPVERDTAWKR